MAVLMSVPNASPAPDDIGDVIAPGAEPVTLEAAGARVGVEGEGGGPGTGPAAEPAAAPAERLERVEAQLRVLTELIEARLRYDATKEEAFAKLYEDLEHFRGRAGAVESRSLYLDLVLLLDRLEQSIGSWEGEQAAAQLLSSVREEVVEILARRGVAAVASPDATFDPRLHRAMGAEPASEEAEHNTVARVLRRGYELDGQVLRPEEVVVRRYSPSAPAGG